MNKSKLKVILFLHIVLMIYSLTGVCSKYAAKQTFLSMKFCLFYGGVILLLGIYAIFWQQVIKRLPITTAFSNKAITVVWGIVWGIIFFGEHITVNKIVGAVLVIAGVILFAFGDKEVAKDE